MKCDCGNEIRDSGIIMECFEGVWDDKTEEWLEGNWDEDMEIQCDECGEYVCFRFVREECCGFKEEQIKVEDMTQS